MEGLSQEEEESTELLSPCCDNPAIINNLLLSNFRKRK